MFNKYFPYEYVKSVFNIDYKKLYENGYRAVIFDIDNTLVHHGGDSTQDIDRLFCHIHDLGLKTLLLSNNDTERILRFTKNIDTLFIADAEKPKKDGYLKAVEMLGLKVDEVIFVGDQIFTDILGANRCGIKSILVEFLRHDDEKHFGRKRMVEKCIMKFYRFSKKKYNTLDIQCERICL